MHLHCRTFYPGVIFMKIRAAALLCAVGLCGCAAEDTEVTTLPSASQTEAYSYTQETAPATETAPPEPETYEAAVQPETAEAVPAPDPVQLAEDFGREYLGLPDIGSVYIFRSKGDTAEINGAECCGVSCYDDSGGSLVFICDFYFTTDGTAAYRYYPDTGSYALLPEQPAFSGFDPENRSAEEIFAQAAQLWEAVHGDTAFIIEGIQPLETAAGRYYPVADERLDTAEELDAALENYFAGELLEQLLAGSDNVITGEDGRLYCLEHSGGDVGYLGTEYSLVLLTEDRAEFTAVARYEYEAGAAAERSCTCIAEKTENGWRFTEFELP